MHCTICKTATDVISQKILKCMMISKTVLQAYGGSSDNGCLRPKAVECE